VRVLTRVATLKPGKKLVPGGNASGGEGRLPKKLCGKAPLKKGGNPSGMLWKKNRSLSVGVEYRVGGGGKAPGEMGRGGRISRGPLLAGNVVKTREKSQRIGDRKRIQGERKWCQVGKRRW